MGLKTLGKWVYDCQVANECCNIRAIWQFYFKWVQLINGSNSKRADWIGKLRSIIKNVVRKGTSPGVTQFTSKPDCLYSYYIIQSLIFRDFGTVLKWLDNYHFRTA